MNKSKVCILTSVHWLFDGRIFHKQTKTLAQADYDVVLIAQHDKQELIDGIRIVPLPETRGKLKRMTKVVWKTLGLALKEKADIYHFHDPELIPVGLVLKLFGKKVIFDVHEHYPNLILEKFWIPKLLRQPVSKMFILFEKISIPCFDYIIYTTPVVGSRYKKARAARIENYPLIKPTKSVGSEKKKKRIIYLGNMTKVRGICELLNAFAVILSKYPDWILYLVGHITPESFAGEIDQLVSDLGIEENVRLIPQVPYEEKDSYISPASIGIVTYLPYPNNMSCLPNKLFDYMLMGLPVIASDFPLYREIIEENECGICLDPTSPKQIEEAIEYLIEHPDEAKKMGENGRKAILEKYNWENEGKKLLTVYKSVLC